jgi:predicted nucleotidyltransferase
MTELAMLAQAVGTSERTLRRAANRGTIRAIRRSPRRLLVTSSEHEYMRRRWPLLSVLIQELRTLPNVRLAMLFGSIARGDDGLKSDLDVLVKLRSDGVRERAQVAERLEAASGRSVQLVSLEDALSAPSLLAEALRDGRVLVDREASWPRLNRREPEIRRQAEQANSQLKRNVGSALKELGVT